MSQTQRTQPLPQQSPGSGFSGGTGTGAGAGDGDGAASGFVAPPPSSRGPGEAMGVVPGGMMQ
jgi:hypothetical protein